MRTISLLVLIIAPVTWVSFVLGTDPTTTDPTAPTPTAPAPAAATADFWGHWGDGKAEISGYALTYPRYDQERTGTAVTIFVTEDFAESVRVKNEDPERDRAEVYPVMKLNWIQDFPTGLYDYSLMTSAFSALEPAGGRPAKALSKVSFSSQEWCGHVYGQLLFEKDRARLTAHSYFDGEADATRTIDVAGGTLSEDAVLLWARGFTGPELAPGEEREVPMLLSLERSRLLHFAVQVVEVKVSRSRHAKSLEVPAGEFGVEQYTIEVPAVQVTKTYPAGKTVTLDELIWEIDVEQAEPRRIIRWTRSDGLEAEMVGSARLPYWSMNGPGFEKELEKIGLVPRPARTP